MSEEFRTVTREDQVTEEILAIVTNMVEGWEPLARSNIEDFINSDEFLDLMETHRLVDGSILDLGKCLSSPAIKMIRKHALNLCN